MVPHFDGSLAGSLTFSIFVENHNYVLNPGYLNFWEPVSKWV